MSSILSKIRGNDSGVGAIEYSLLVAILSVTVIAAIAG